MGSAEKSQNQKRASDHWIVEPPRKFNVTYRPTPPSGAPPAPQKDEQRRPPKPRD